MDSNASLEIVDADASNYQSHPHDEPHQDDSFATPVKIFDSVTSTPRRSPRVPIVKKSPDYCYTQNRAICKLWDDGECPDTMPSSPDTPKSKTTSTPRLFQDEFVVDTPTSPNLEAVSANDSFVVPTALSKVLQVSPRNSPSKTRLPSGSGSTPSKITPSKANDKAWPSPYKNHRPKYLPKNIKLVKKKRMERNAFLEKVQQFDAQLVKLPSAFASPKRPVNPIPSNDGDIMGTQSPLFVIFNPEQFFASYDEHSFDTHFDVNLADIERFVKLNPHLATSKDCRALTLFLTVTSDNSFFNIMSPYVEDYLANGTYTLDWEDLKSILINLGLAKDYYEFDSTAYYKIEPPKLPKIWNFEFLFTLVEYSFPSYSKIRLMRLVKFLSDCLFDPVLLQCHPNIVLILRQVVEHLVQNDVASEDLLTVLNHSHYSWISNRVVIQSLSPSPVLIPLTRTLAYRTLLALLKLDFPERFDTLSHISDVLSDVQRIRKETVIKDVYQLIIICENLVTMGDSPFDIETKTFLEKLADFAEHMSLGYTYFENLYFTDTVTRLRTLSSINYL